MQTSLKKPTTARITDGLLQLQKEIHSQMTLDALKDSIYFEQNKDRNDPKIQQLRKKYGKGLGKDYNNTFGIVPKSENFDNLFLFREAAEELGLNHRFTSPMYYIGSVYIDIQAESVLFAGLKDCARVNTYSITKEEIINALKETR